MATPRASVSRFGDISPAFAARCGVSVDVAFQPAARHARARALSAAAQQPRVAAPRPVLPLDLGGERALPAGRVHTTIVSAPRR